jgi:hypothetical protein
MKHEMLTSPIADILYKRQKTPLGLISVLVLFFTVIFYNPLSAQSNLLKMPPNPDSSVKLANTDSASIHIIAGVNKIFSGDTVGFIVHILSNQLPGTFCDSAVIQDITAAVSQRSIIIINGISRPPSASPSAPYSVLECFKDGLDTLQMVLWNPEKTSSVLHQIRIAGKTFDAMSEIFSVKARIWKIDIRNLHNNSNLDTLVLSSSNGMDTLLAEGYSLDSVDIGTVPCTWRATNGLHSISNGTSKDKIIYSSTGVNHEESGFIIARYEADSSIADSLYVRIIGTSSSQKPQPSKTKENIVRKEFFRIGINISGGLTNIADLNKVANAWLETRDDSLSSSALQVSHKNDEISFNFEYGFQPFFAFTFFDHWQVGGKLDYLVSPHIYNFLLDDTIQIELATYIPGVFTSLRLGIFEIEAGGIYGISTIKWNDNFFGYSSNWPASGWGYEINATLSPHGKYVGFTFSTGYRSLVMTNVVDNYHRRIRFADSGDPLKLDMSGFTMNIGLYFLLSYKKAGDQ